MMSRWPADQSAKPVIYSASLILPSSCSTSFLRSTRTLISGIINLPIIHHSVP
jgi:hypothetical protein